LSTGGRRVSDNWYEDVKIERNKFDILIKLVMKYRQWDLIEEFWTYFEGSGWEQTKDWEEEE